MLKDITTQVQNTQPNFLNIFIIKDNLSNNISEIKKNIKNE